MKKQFLILIISAFCFWNCNPIYKQYKILNQNIDKKSKYSSEKKRVIKYIVSKANNSNFLLIISWNKSMITEENITFKALVYDYTTKEKKIFYNTKENNQDILVSTDIPMNNFTEFLFILENYKNHKEKYLLSLHDSMSSSEANFPINLYDFSNNIKLKIASIYIDKNGKLIQ